MSARAQGGASASWHAPHVWCPSPASLSLKLAALNRAKQWQHAPFFISKLAQRPLFHPPNLPPQAATMPPKRGASGNNKRQKEDNGVIMGHKLYALKQEYPGAAQYAAGACAGVRVGLVFVRWDLNGVWDMPESSMLAAGGASRATDLTICFSHHTPAHPQVMPTPTSPWASTPSSGRCPPCAT